MTKIRRKTYRWSLGSHNREHNLARANIYETQAFAQFDYIASCIQDYWSSHYDIGTREFIRDISEAKDNLLTIFGDLVFEIGNTGWTKLESIEEVEEEEEEGDGCETSEREVESQRAHHIGVRRDEEDDRCKIAMTDVEESTARLVYAIRCPEDPITSASTRKTLRERISLTRLGFRPSSRNGVPRGTAPAVENKAERKRDKVKKVLRRLSFRGKGSPMSFSPPALP